MKARLYLTKLKRLVVFNRFMKIFSQNNLQRGDVSIYLSLILLTTMLTGAIVMSTILARQIRANQDVLKAERAFYTAYSGFEDCMSYALIWKNPYYNEERQCDSGGTREYVSQDDPTQFVTETIPNIAYSTEEATYVGKSKAVENEGGIICVWGVVGNFKGFNRKVISMGPGCS